MKTLALALALLPASAHARVLDFTCTLRVVIGAPTEPSDTHDVGWSPNGGFERPGGLIELGAAGVRARVNVVRDPEHQSGFFYRYHLEDQQSGKTFDGEFLDSTSLRPRPEGSMSISCVIDA